MLPRRSTRKAQTTDAADATTNKTIKSTPDDAPGANIATSSTGRKSTRIRKSTTVADAVQDPSITPTAATVTGPKADPQKSMSKRARSDDDDDEKIDKPTSKKARKSSKTNNDADEDRTEDRSKMVTVLKCGAAPVGPASLFVMLSTISQIGPVNVDPSLHLSMSTCILTDTWPLSYLYWLPFLAFEALLFALALAKGVQSVREHELELNAAGFGLGLCSKTPGRAAKALEILIKDSILYFLLIFTIYLANALAWIIEDGRIDEIPVAPAVALSTVMAQRLLLNIRENFERRRAGVDADVSTAGASETFVLSTMAFDGLCAVSESEAGAGVGSPNVVHGEQSNTSGRAWQAIATSSTLSGSTAVSPVSPVSPNEVGAQRNA